MSRNIAFVGAVPRILFDGRDYAIIVLTNPPQSGVNVRIETLTFANLSRAILAVEFFPLLTFEGKLQKAAEPVPANFGLYGTVEAQAKILYGNCIERGRGYSLGFLTVPPYETATVKPMNIVLGPGDTRFYLLKTLECTEAVMSLYLGWLEEPRCHDLRS